MHNYFDDIEYDFNNIDDHAAAALQLTQAAIYRDVKVQPNLVCPFIAVSQSGVFLAVRGGKLDIRYAEDLIPLLHLTTETYIWLADEEHQTEDDAMPGYFYDESKDTLVEVPDVGDSMCNVYRLVRTGQFIKRMRAHDDLIAAIRGLHDDVIVAAKSKDDFSDTLTKVPDAMQKSRIDLINDTIAGYKNSNAAFKTNASDKYKTVNDQLFIKKFDQIGREKWYPVNDELDPDEHFRTCLFFGVFGIHRFKEGRVLKGLFYLLTLGLFGTLWIADVISMLCDNYRLKDGSYLGHINKKEHAAQIPVGILVSVLIVSLGVFGFLKGTSVLSQKYERARQGVTYEQLSPVEQKLLEKQLGITEESFQAASSAAEEAANEAASANETAAEAETTHEAASNEMTDEEAASASETASSETAEEAASANETASVRCAHTHP